MLLTSSRKILQKGRAKRRGLLCSVYFAHPQQEADGGHVLVDLVRGLFCNTTYFGYFGILFVSWFVNAKRGYL
jgi:hypothetical protein